jgi:uncharacterized membrane protein YkoI
MVITKIKVSIFTMTKTAKSKVAGKKVLLTAVMSAVVAAVILTGIFVAYPAISSASAIQSTNTTTNTASGNGQFPKIIGSINVVQTTKNIIKDNLKVPFSQAADIAGKQITNGTVVGGHLGVVQGYLAYTFFAVNPTAQTGYLTIVDAGNGKVLYTSQGQQMGIGSFGTSGALGPHGQHGSADGWEHGPFGSGPWRSQGGFFGGGGGMWH